MGWRRQTKAGILTPTATGCTRPPHIHYHTHHRHNDRTADGENTLSAGMVCALIPPGASLDSDDKRLPLSTHVHHHTPTAQPLGWISSLFPPLYPMFPNARTIACTCVSFIFIYIFNFLASETCV